MNPMSPVPADPELDALKARLRVNLAQVVKKSETCRPGSRIHRLKTRMVNTREVAALIDEDQIKQIPRNGTEGTQEIPRNGTKGPKTAPVPAIQGADRPQGPQAT